MTTIYFNYANEKKDVLELKTFDSKRELLDFTFKHLGIKFASHEKIHKILAKKISVDEIIKQLPSVKVAGKKTNLLTSLKLKEAIKLYPGKFPDVEVKKPKVKKVKEKKTKEPEVEKSKKKKIIKLPEEKPVIIPDEADDEDDTLDLDI